MQSEVVLTFRDESGERREVPVASRRFTIGSGTGNDLRVDAPGVARRHAVIETYEDGVFIYDCQSLHGTLLNNAPLRGSAPLRGGDLLTLGGSYDITVELRGLRAVPTPEGRTTPAASRAQARSRAAPRLPRAEAPATRNESDGAGPSLKHAAAAAVVLMLVIAGLFLLAAWKQAQVGAADGVNARSDPSPVEADPERPKSTEEPVERVGAADDEELKRAAVRAVQRASGDDRPYPFPAEALRDIARQVEQDKQSDAAGLRDAFTAMRRDGRAIAAQARAASVPPDMVIYAAIAESDSGRDPSAAARRMLPQLSELRATFGGDSADSTLLVLAAYTYGVGSKKSHPLLATVRKLVRNPFVERNVWYLRERGGLNDASYNFVIRTLAVGVIAQEPRRYGVQADPLVY